VRYKGSSESQSALIAVLTDLGFKAIINGQALAAVHRMRLQNYCTKWQQDDRAYIKESALTQIS